MSENKTKMFPSVSFHDDKHKDPLSNESGVAEEKGTRATMLHLNQTETGNRQTSKISSLLSSDFGTKFLLPSKPVDAQFHADRSKARHNLPLLNSQDSQDPLKNGIPNTNNINENRVYSSLSYSDLGYRTDVNTNSDNKYIWTEKFDSEEMFGNHFPSNKTGSSNRKIKDTVSQNKEILDQKTEKKKNLKDSSKNYSSSTTNTKMSHYLRRSLSVPDYDTEVSRNVNKMTNNTLHLAVDNYDNSVYKTSQGDIGIASASGTSVKDFRSYMDDGLNYAEAELNEGRVRKTLTKTSSGVPRKISNQGKFDLQTNDGSDLDINQEVESSNKEFYGNKMPRKRKEKIGNILLLPKWSFLLSKHYQKVVEILDNKLGEHIILHLKNNHATFLSSNTDLIKSLLENDVTIIDHDPNEQSWLKASIKQWKNAIDILQSSYFCVIFSEEDFSKTYICTSTENVESVHSLISEFLDECLTDVRISPEVREFVTHNETFSDLKFQEKAQDGIRIQDINRSRLAELKKEIKKVTFQSYLLNENEYEFLCEDKNEILSDVEKKFHVKGRPYIFSVAGEIPQLLQVNPLVNISCILTSDPENIPLDSFIVIDLQTPKPETDYIAILQEEKYKIFQYDSWNPPRNQINLSVPELEKKAYSWNLIFEECFKIVFNNDNFPHTIGITIPTELAEHLQEFCQSISSAVTKLPNNDDKPTYILLLVKTSEMMNDVFNILKRPSAETPRSKVSSHSSESDTRHSDTSTEGCSVEVITGSITDMQVDVIVASANSKLNMGLGKVSSELSMKAGPDLQRECVRNYPEGISFPEIGVCKGYHLPCHFIFFGDIPAYDRKNDKHIAIFVEACLQRATVLKFKSIAFTALGTGSLGYEPKIVAEQMASAIAKFKATTSQSSLKKIMIVLHPSAMKMDDFLKLRTLSTSVKVSKAVPPQKTEPLPQTKEKQALKLRYQQLQWIPFVNYSTKRETLDKAIMKFEKELNYVTFTVSQEEAEDLFFFFDLNSLVPDIVEQLCLKQEALVVPRKSSEKFKTHLNQLRNHCNKYVQNIPSNVNQEQIRYFLIKINQEYPRVKCKISNNEQDVLFKTFEFERGEEAKYQLDCYIGLRKNISAPKDRFRTNEQESSDINEANTPVSSTLESEKAERDGDKISHTYSQFSAEGPSRNEGIAHSAQNIQNISCFPMGDSLLVKVYEADILNLEVDGIVNAANRYLDHGGGVARAIIDAAGDLVNIEGQTKRNERALNDGEVLSTSAGNLTQYKNIIHAVGPRYSTSNKNCQTKLEETIYNSLAEANRLGLRSVALPAISSAIFGVPLDICTEAYVMGVKVFYKTMPSNCQLKEVHFVDINSNTCKAIKDKFEKYLNEVTDVPGNNIHQSNDNSTNISSYEDDAMPPMSLKADKDNSAKQSSDATDDTSHNNQQSNNSTNIPSDKSDAMPPMSPKADKDNSAKQSSDVTDDTSHNNQQSNNNSTNIPSDKSDAIADINAKTCVMCKCKTPEAQQLKCDHRLCSDCKKTLSQPMCPSCKIPFEMFYGDQPNGSMVVSEISDPLPGFPDAITYEIVYSMEDNKWKAPRKAFLPKNKNGNTILKMLQLAFRQRLIFTFLKSSSQRQFLTWGDINHKTSKYGGISKYSAGYPDPDYFNRVTMELAAKGITPDLVAKKKIESKIVLS